MTNDEGRIQLALTAEYQMLPTGGAPGTCAGAWGEWHIASEWGGAASSSEVHGRSSGGTVVVGHVHCTSTRSCRSRMYLPSLYFCDGS